MRLPDKLAVYTIVPLVLMFASCQMLARIVVAPEPRLPLTCTPAPPAPPDAPSDWADVVHSNCFDDLQRLGRWMGGTDPLQPGESPESNFMPAGAASIDGSGIEVVVLVHGWAPGYRRAVDEAGGRIRWWTTGATNSSGVYTSDWAWVETAVDTSPVSVCVSKTGFYQQLQAHDANRVILGFSWIDHSATGGSFFDLIEVYRSEAYTNISGIRLANALETALAPTFWTNPGNHLHLIGHSHGSKVATVAALTLQQRDKQVDHLTILDSPESEITLEGNGANLLGFYLQQMQIADPNGNRSGAFVDNYASFFGGTFGNLDNIVDVNLQPSALYSLTQAGDQHSYAAAWYAGAAAAVATLGLPPLGFDWPPPPATFTPTLNQSFTAASGMTDPCSSSTGLDPSQWQLTAGSPQLGPFTYSTVSTPIEVDETTNVTCTPSCDNPESLALRPGTGNATAIFRGGYSNSLFSDGFGLAFDVTLTGAMAGDYLVATVDSPEEGIAGFQEVIMVIDGRSNPAGTYPVAFNADISSEFDDVSFAIYFVPASGSNAEVTIANFRRVLVSGVR